MMDTHDIPNRVASEWQPITDKLALAVLGKLAEEAGELTSALCRCIIQGINEHPPTSLKPNKEWVEDEIADVLAMAEFAVRYLDLDRTGIDARRARKMEFKRPWFESLTKKS